MLTTTMRSWPHICFFFQPSESVFERSVAERQTLTSQVVVYLGKPNRGGAAESQKEAPKTPVGKPGALAPMRRPTLHLGRGQRRVKTRPKRMLARKHTRVYRASTAARTTPRMLVALNLWPPPPPTGVRTAGRPTRPRRAAWSPARTPPRLAVAVGEMP